MRKDRGLTLTEGMLGIAVLAAVIAPILSSYWMLVRGFNRASRQATAMNLAQQIVDHVRYRLYNNPSHPVPLHRGHTGDPTYTLDCKSFMQSLNQMAEKKIATDSDMERASYFMHFGNRMANGEWPGISDHDSNLYQQLKEFSCLVQINTAGLDSDLNGQEEKDMAEISVTMFWNEDGVNREQRLRTVVTMPQHAMGHQ